MEDGWDLLECLGPDASTTVFSYLQDPADLVRATAVSRSWRRFIIANGFSKKLCTKLCPEVSYFTHIKEITPPGTTRLDESSSAGEWRNHVRHYKIYTYLSSHLISIGTSENCISRCIGASSTDIYPDETIENTLNSRLTFWSSSGQVDPTVPESLTYSLNYDIGFVDEIRIQPFRAFYQFDTPIYSSKYVQFKMGYSKIPNMHTISKLDQGQLTAEENYVWTYISPEFPMQQEDVLQVFKLPRPALCIGGVVKIELLGRVQRQEFDNLFYICICNVQVKGRALSPVLGVDLSEIEGGGAALKYCPIALAPAALDGDVVSVTDSRRKLSRQLAFTAQFWRLVPLHMLAAMIVFCSIHTK